MVDSLSSYSVSGSEYKIQIDFSVCFVVFYYLMISLVHASPHQIRYQPSPQVTSKDLCSFHTSFLKPEQVTL